MEQKLVCKNSPDIRKIRRLYDMSFPNEERVPFFHLMNSAGRDRVMHAYYQDEELVGLTVMFLAYDIAYLSYICIEPELQDKGYGTMILDMLKDTYRDYRMAIDIEETESESDNLEDRLRRKAFYVRNGFESTGVFYTYNGVEYEILSWNGIISKEDWQKTIEKHWGKYAAFATYR